MQEVKKDWIQEIIDIMARLRAPDGCAWDKKQDHQSLKPYLIEESCEVLDAIDDEDMELLEEELRVRGEELNDIARETLTNSAQCSLDNMEDFMRHAQIIKSLNDTHPPCSISIDMQNIMTQLYNLVRIKLRTNPNVSDEELATFVTVRTVLTAAVVIAALFCGTEQAADSDKETFRTYAIADMIKPSFWVKHVIIAREMVSRDIC